MKKLSTRVDNVFVAFAIILHFIFYTLHLSAAPTANEDFVLSEIAKATNNIPRPDMSGYVQVDENGTVTLRKNGSDDGAIVISPNTGYPYPSIRVRNPNWTDAYIFVGDGISINDTPNHGRTIRVDGTGYEGQRIDIGYSMEYGEETRCVPHITVDGTNMLETIGSSLASLSSITSAVATVGPAATNYTDSAIATADTSYRRVYSLTNLNQTVQFVELDETQTSLAIELPSSGDTKDWLVYVYAATNTTLSLPSGVTWWTSDAANTNAIDAATPTALYFSQVSTNIFMFGRQTLESIGGAQ